MTGRRVAVACLVLALCLAAMWARIAAPTVPVRTAMALDDYLGVARTGDLMFFASDDVDALHSHVSPMTHVAVVVAHDNDVWLLETHESGAVRGHGAGVHAYPASPRLRAYDGQLVVAPVRVPLDASAMLRAAEDLRHVPYMDRGLRVHMAQCKLLGRSVVRPRGMICSEFALALAQAAGVLRGLDTWECVTPSDLLHAAATSGEFTEPVELVNLQKKMSHT